MDERSSITIPILQDIDVDSAIKRLGGNNIIYGKIMNSFKKKYSHYSEIIDLEIEQGNINSALHQVHSLKGIAATLGAQKVSDAARTLENALNNHSEKEIPYLTKQLSIHLADLFISIGKYNFESSYGINIQYPREEDLYSLEFAVKILYKLISDDDSNALYQMKVVKLLSKGTTHENDLIKVSNAIGAYNFTYAMKNINEWAKVHNVDLHM
jgi:HPt (histidine-containing phosphotransfer) domain-containing protein